MDTITDAGFPKGGRSPACGEAPAGPETAAPRSPGQGTDARHPAEAKRTRETVGYQSGFDRFNDPSAGSPRCTELEWGISSPPSDAPNYLCGASALVAGPVGPGD